MNSDILSMANAMENIMIKDRRYLHEHPELSFEEFETMDYICKRLTEQHIPFQSGIVGTGVLAEVKGKGEGRCILIRADMDALPIQEKNELDFASKKPSVMHACGHDAHTAILLSACCLLNTMKENFCGTVKFAFQPGEETRGGAKPMIDAGILENPRVDACIALHVDTDIPVGKIKIQSGPVYASPDDFFITIHGKGGHGAEPQSAIDPILIASKIIVALNEMPKPNRSVVTACSVHGGDATNVIPDTTVISGTARSLDHETRVYLETEIENIVKKIASAHGASYSYVFDKLFPPLINSADIASMIEESANYLLGEENCITEGFPTMAGEDFSYFAMERPSAIFKLGCRNEAKGIIAPIHNSRFNIDEAALKYGLAVFVKTVLRFL